MSQAVNGQSNRKGCKNLCCGVEVPKGSFAKVKGLICWLQWWSIDEENMIPLRLYFKDPGFSKPGFVKTVQSQDSIKSSGPRKN